MYVTYTSMPLLSLLSDNFSYNKVIISAPFSKAHLQCVDINVYKLFIIILFH